MSFSFQHSGFDIGQIQQFLSDDALWGIHQHPLSVTRRRVNSGLVKIGDIGRVFLVATLTAFVPRAFSFPGSAWERKGRAALPLQERPQAEPAKQGVPEQSPGTRVIRPLFTLSVAQGRPKA
jgi:hypothetical protein